VPEREGGPVAHFHFRLTLVLEASHFVSYDTRENALAKAVGMKVLAP
jgi:hypothetical protein